MARTKKVLELGCGPGSITKVLQKVNRCSVVGVERDRSAIDIVQDFCEEVIQADLNTAEWTLLVNDRRFDVVVAADVLEHLYDPWKTLSLMGAFLNEGGSLVISLPHVGHAAIAGCICGGNFDYRDWGLLDRTHIRFFGLKNMEDLFKGASLKIVDAHYVVKPPEETEFASQWASLPTDVRTALKRSPHSDIYQVVLRAVPLHFPGRAIALFPPPKSKSKLLDIKSMKKALGSKLSPANKLALRRLLSRLGIRV